MNRSLLLLKQSECPAVRAICFPFAGGNAAFVRNWSMHLPTDVELLGVHYPGRDGSVAEQLLRTPQAIAESIADEIASRANLPLILFGYSLGAFVAYETCKQLLRLGLRTPIELVVAAARAAHLPRKRAATASLPDAEFIAKLRGYGGTPESVLQDKALMEYFVPILKADFAAAEAYRYTPAPPLPWPITALVGTEDESVDEEVMTAWEFHTSKRFRLHRLAGGHFFLNEQSDAVIAIIRQIASQLVGVNASANSRRSQCSSTSH